MKKNIKLLLFICVALLTFCTNVFNVNAKIIEQGSYVNNPWYLNEEKTMYAYIWNKVLYIKGTGELSNERYYYLLYNDIASNKADFFYLDIGEGITRIPGDGYETPFSDFEIRAIHIPKSVKVIPDYVFCDVIGLDTDDSNYGIFYDGTEEEWEAVNKGIGNDSLENARISFNGSKKISDLEYDIYDDSKKKDDIRTIDPRHIGFLDLYIMPDPTLPVRYNSIIRNEDILDFGLTHYTGIINY